MILSPEVFNTVNASFASLLQLMQADWYFFIEYNYASKNIIIINGHQTPDIEIINSHSEYFYNDLEGVLLWHGYENLIGLNSLFGSSDGASAVFRDKKNCYILSIASTAHKYKFYSQVINNISLLKLVTTNVHNKLREIIPNYQDLSSRFIPISAE